MSSSEKATLPCNPEAQPAGLHGEILRVLCKEYTANEMNRALGHLCAHIG